MYRPKIRELFGTETIKLEWEVYLKKMFLVLNNANETTELLDPDGSVACTNESVSRTILSKTKAVTFFL